MEATIVIPSGELQMNKLIRFVKDDSGATAIEYGIIAAATGLALVAVMPTIKTKLTATFTSISSALS